MNRLHIFRYVVWTTIVVVAVAAAYVFFLRETTLVPRATFSGIGPPAFLMPAGFRTA